MDGNTRLESGRPVVAVLPFAVAAGDDEAGLLAEGMHEDICGELTRFRSLVVISPASAAAVSELSDDEVGHRLGASHVLRGRVRRAGASLQLSASLGTTTGSAQLWADHFPLRRDDLGACEQQVIARIVATLNVKLEEAVLADARRRPPERLAAYGLTLRGLHLVRRGTREANDGARALFDQALALDPLYARAHSGLSLCWFNQWNCMNWDRFEEASRRAYRHARDALELDDGDAMVHLVIAQVALFRGAWEQAAWYLDRALMLCPNDADLLVQAAVLEVFLGHPQAARRHVECAMRINPFHPNDYFAFASVAAIFDGDLETGLACLARCDAFPLIDIPAFAAAAEAHLGRLAAARAHYDRFVAGYRTEIARGADFAASAPLAWLFEVNPFRRPGDVEFLREGFRLLDLSCAAAEVGTAPGAAQGLLALSTAGWIADFAGQRVVIPNLKGMHDIRRLLETPGGEIHCLDLSEREAEVPGGDAMLDEKARNALKTRIRDLQEEIVEAEDRNDIGRAEVLRTEMDGILAVLSAALGLGGRRRKLGDLAEKARTAVTWRIRHALRRIETAHPALGRHLANSLRTGTFCTYRPESPIVWRFQAPQPPAMSVAPLGTRRQRGAR